VCDIAQLLRSQPQLDLMHLLERADKLGYRRMFLLAIELAHSILDVTLPEAIAREASFDPTVLKMAQRLQAQLLKIDPTPPPLSPLREALRMVGFHLRVLHRTRDRFRYLKYAAKPNPRDRKAAELPASLQFLHVFSRPVRLFRRYALRSAA
jgi:hypothetical protein